MIKNCSSHSFAITCRSFLLIIKYITPECKIQKVSFFFQFSVAVCSICLFLFLYIEKQALRPIWSVDGCMDVDSSDSFSIAYNSTPPLARIRIIPILQTNWVHTNNHRDKFRYYSNIFLFSLNLTIIYSLANSISMYLFRNC